MSSVRLRANDEPVSQKKARTKTETLSLEVTAVKYFPGCIYNEPCIDISIQVRTYIHTSTSLTPTNKSRPTDSQS
jgi:hypothetical protein